MITKLKNGFLKRICKTRLSKAISESYPEIKESKDNIESNIEKLLSNYSELISRTMNNQKIGYAYFVEQGGPILRTLPEERKYFFRIDYDISLYKIQYWPKIDSLKLIKKKNLFINVISSYIFYHEEDKICFKTQPLKEFYSTKTEKEKNLAEQLLKELRGFKLRGGEFAVFPYKNL